MVSVHPRPDPCETGDSWSQVAVLYRTNSQSQSASRTTCARARYSLPYLQGFVVLRPQGDQGPAGLPAAGHQSARRRGVPTHRQLPGARHRRHDRRPDRRSWPPNGACRCGEAVDALVAEPTADAVQKTIVRKVAEFVAMIRALSLLRVETGLYEFGLEVASRSGILALYRLENTPEAASAPSTTSRSCLNSMQEFREQRDAEIRAAASVGGGSGHRRGVAAERHADDRSWTRTTRGPEQRVTLMTVHSAKGWSTNTSTSSAWRRTSSPRSGPPSRPTAWRRSGGCSTWR